MNVKIVVDGVLDQSAKHCTVLESTGLILFSSKAEARHLEALLVVKLYSNRGALLSWIQLYESDRRSAHHLQRPEISVCDYGKGMRRIGPYIYIMQPFSVFCSLANFSVGQIKKSQLRFGGKERTRLVPHRRHPSKLQSALQMFNGFSAFLRQTKSKQAAEAGAVNVKTVASLIAGKKSKAKGPRAHLALELWKY